MKPKGTEMRSVAVFDDRDDAYALILDLPQVLCALGLGDRFDVNWSPRILTERQRRGRSSKITGTFYEVLMVDKSPAMQPPDITEEDVVNAWAKVRKEKSEADVEHQESRMTAFGRTQDIKTWARLFKTNTSTIRKLTQEYGNLEEALSAIALKKSPR